METHFFRTFFSAEIESKKQQIRRCVANCFENQEPASPSSQLLVEPPEEDQANRQELVDEPKSCVSLTTQIRESNAISIPSMETTAILSTITKIREENMLFDINKKGVSVLHNHIIDLDDVTRTVCIHAEIRPDCLDRGSDLTELSYYNVVCSGIIPGDDAIQIISKKLGGPGDPFNVAPLNSKLDLSTWRANEDIIYNCVKLNQYARLQFAFEYDDDREDELILRPTKMYYHFVLYNENDQVTGQIMEGFIDNIDPEKTYDSSDFVIDFL